MMAVLSPPCCHPLASSSWSSGRRPAPAPAVPATKGAALGKKRRGTHSRKRSCRTAAASRTAAAAAGSTLRHRKGKAVFQRRKAFFLNKKATRLSLGFYLPAAGSAVIRTVRNNGAAGSTSPPEVKGQGKGGVSATITVGHTGHKGGVLPDECNKRDDHQPCLTFRTPYHLFSALPASCGRRSWPFTIRDSRFSAAAELAARPSAATTFTTNTLHNEHPSQRTPFTTNTPATLHLEPRRDPARSNGHLTALDSVPYFTFSREYGAGS